MQCDCRDDLESKLKEHVAKNLPEGYEDLDASLQGYGFGIDRENLTMVSKFQAAYRGDVMIPKKNGGGMKRQKIDTVIWAKYCPFCGMSAEANEEDA